MTNTEQLIEFHAPLTAREAHEVAATLQAVVAFEQQLEAKRNPESHVATVMSEARMRRLKNAEILVSRLLDEARSMDVAEVRKENAALVR